MEKNTEWLLCMIRVDILRKYVHINTIKFTEVARNMKVANCSKIINIKMDKNMENVPNMILSTKLKFVHKHTTKEYNEDILDIMTKMTILSLRNHTKMVKSTDL